MALFPAQGGRVILLLICHQGQFRAHNGQVINTSIFLEVRPSIFPGALFQAFCMPFVCHTLFRFHDAGAEDVAYTQAETTTAIRTTGTPCQHARQCAACTDRTSCCCSFEGFGGILGLRKSPGCK
uniref:Putative secreted protein n=1 Tax=Ixodes ricinus TaxID=34613 RepID=A0A6B0UPB1_IXORI